MKLWSVGITDKLWIWFQSYLSNRTQIVSINNCLSDPLPVKSGVPQGSILGPLLFVIYINDLLSSIIYSNFFKFADDVKCYKAIHNPYDSQSLQLDIDSLFHWSLDNKLSFNTMNVSFYSVNLLSMLALICLITSIIESYPKSQNIVIWVLSLRRIYHGTLIMKPL